MMSTKTCSFLLTAWLLGGCTAAAYGPIEKPAIGLDQYIDNTYAAVDKLVDQLDKQSHRVRKEEPILVATLVSVDELDTSSRLGRSVSEQVAARFTQKGYPVIEVKLRGNLFVKRGEGELLLSRELSEISQSHRASAVVVGTYAPASNFVHVNLKVVASEKQVVLAAADYGLPLDNNTKALLAIKSSR